MARLFVKMSIAHRAVYVDDSDERYQVDRKETQTLAVGQQEQAEQR